MRLNSLAKQTILQWRATIAGVAFHTYHAFKPCVFIITLHETQHVFRKLRHLNGIAFRIPETWELSALWRERERRGELSVLSVMYSSADPLRSLSSMISILINTCFITPLKHTYCSSEMAWFISSAKFCQTAPLLWGNYRASVFLRVHIVHLSALNQGPFHQKLTCYTHSPASSASQAENRSLTRHTQTHTKTQWPWEIEGPADEDRQSELCVITLCVSMASGLSHPMQRKTLHTAQPNRPTHVQTLRVLRVEGNICLTDWRDGSEERRRGDVLFSALMPAVFLCLKPDYTHMSHHHLPAVTMLTHTLTQAVYHRLTCCLCVCMPSCLSTCF